MGDSDFSTYTTLSEDYLSNILTEIVDLGEPTKWIYDSGKLDWLFSLKEDQSYVPGSVESLKGHQTLEGYAVAPWKYDHYGKDSELEDFPEPVWPDDYVVTQKYLSFFATEETGSEQEVSASIIKYGYNALGALIWEEKTNFQRFQLHDQVEKSSQWHNTTTRYAYAYDFDLDRFVWCTSSEDLLYFYRDDDFVPIEGTFKKVVDGLNDGEIKATDPNVIIGYGDYISQETIEIYQLNEQESFGILYTCTWDLLTGVIEVDTSIVPISQKREKTKNDRFTREYPEGDWEDVLPDDPLPTEEITNEDIQYPADADKVWERVQKAASTDAEQLTVKSAVPIPTAMVGQVVRIKELSIEQPSPGGSFSIPQGDYWVVGVQHNIGKKWQTTLQLRNTWI